MEWEAAPQSEQEAVLVFEEMRRQGKLLGQHCQYGEEFLRSSQQRLAVELQKKQDGSKLRASASAFKEQRQQLRREQMMQSPAPCQQPPAHSGHEGGLTEAEKKERSAWLD